MDDHGPRIFRILFTFNRQTVEEYSTDNGVDILNILYLRVSTTLHPSAIGSYERWKTKPKKVLSV